MQQCVTDMMALDLKESVLLYAHKSSLNTEVAIKFTCVQHFQKVHCIVQAQLSYHTHCEGGREDAARPNRLMTERQCLLTGLTPLLVLPISIGDMSNGSRVVDSKLVLSRGLKV